MVKQTYITNFIVMSKQSSGDHEQVYMIRDPITDEKFIMKYNGNIELEANQKIKIKTDKISLLKRSHRMIEPYNIVLTELF